jgi:hypothetical protein
VFPTFGSSLSGSVAFAATTLEWRDSRHEIPIPPLAGALLGGAPSAFAGFRFPPDVIIVALSAAWHRTDRDANNRVECDHGRLKARLRAMRGLKEDRSVKVIIAGLGFIQNIRRGHYELAVDEPAGRRVAVAFDELAVAI